ncbi:MAG TPA: STAS domain-containing protein [Bryobacteraceae bacterium]|nr:STAS domain-containing protein [Bryobacteraceae bacterium]
MTSHAEWIAIDPERAADSLQEAVEKVNSAEGEVTLDFSAVRRIDAPAARAVEQLAVAESRPVKLVLHAVNGDIYKVLKLLQLTARFTFGS